MEGRQLHQLHMPFVADQLGLSSRPLRVELSALAKVKAPAILHWDLNHYVVLRSVTSRSIVIHDPAIGVRTLPLAEVSKHFTGVVLELTPTANFRVVHARAPVRLSSLWSQMTGFASAFTRRCNSRDDSETMLWTSTQ
jgi:ATP-binding cassette subfamily B protein RaxB